MRYFNTAFQHDIKMSSRFPFFDNDGLNFQLLFIWQNIIYHCALILNLTLKWPWYDLIVSKLSQVSSVHFEFLVFSFQNSIRFRILEGQQGVTHGKIWFYRGPDHVDTLHRHNDSISGCLHGANDVSNIWQVTSHVILVILPWRYRMFPSSCNQPFYHWNFHLKLLFGEFRAENEPGLVGNIFKKITFEQSSFQCRFNTISFWISRDLDIFWSIFNRNVSPFLKRFLILFFFIPGWIYWKDFCFQYDLLMVEFIIW